MGEVIQSRARLVGSPSASRPTVSVIIPALNEARNLPDVLRRIPTDVYEVILVDGQSVDGSIDVARECFPGVRVIAQNRRGKGNALACGLSAAGGDIVVLLDGDGSADPSEIPGFVAALMAGAHYAKGTRFVDGGGSEDITRFRQFGNRQLNRLVDLLYGTDWTDLCYGYNAFWRTCLPLLEIGEAYVELKATDQPPSYAPSALHWGDGFEIETLINVRVHAAGLVVAEVPSFERRRLHGASNLRAVRDGLRVLRTIASERRRLRGAQRAEVPELQPWDGPWLVENAVELRGAAVPRLAPNGSTASADITLVAVADPENVLSEGGTEHRIVAANLVSTAPDDAGTASLSI
jgi:Glycosyl transferase family 2